MSSNRYQDLLRFVPTGGFYAQDGIVLPHRNSQYPLRFVTSAPNTIWGVFLNSRYQGIVTTDASGVATVPLLLDNGTNDIVLQQEGTGVTVQSTVSATDFASWMAGEADQLQLIDAEQEEMLADSHLADCAPDMLGLVWGVTANIESVGNYSSDTYRDLIQELRQAYRPFGATRRGLDNVVSSITQVRPLLYQRAKFGPRWVLGTNFLENSDLQDYLTEMAPSSLPNINSGHPNNATVTFVDGSDNGVVPLGVGHLDCKGILVLGHPYPFLRWRAADGTTSTYQQAVNGVNTLVNTRQLKATILTVESSGGQISLEGTSSVLYISMDGKGTITVSFGSASATPTAIMNAINTAFNSSPLYGAGYAGVATLNTLGSLEQQVVITTPTNPSAGGYIEIHRAPSGGNAAAGLFDIPYNHSTLTVNASVSQTSITVDTATIDRLPWATNSDHFQQFQIRLRDFTTTTTEVATVTAANHGTGVLSLSSGLAYNYPSGAIVELLTAWPVRVDGVQDTWTLQVNVVDYTVLPSNLITATTDNLTFEGPNAPTGWIIATGTTPNAPTNYDGPPDFADPPTISVIEPGYLAKNVLKIHGAFSPTQISTHVTSRILDYKGFQVDFDVWMCTELEDVNTAEVWLEMSFDGGTTWQGGLGGQSFFIPPGPADRYRPHRFSRQFTIPTNATDVWARILVGDFDYRIERFHLQQSSDTALWLGSNTIPRNEQRSKFGYFAYVWSPDQLTSTEDGILGLPFGTVGKMDDVLPAHMYLERFDVSEYDGGGNSKNAIGVFDEVDFALCTISNMGLQIRTPSRFTFLTPSVVSQQTFNITSWDLTYTVTLPLQSDQGYSGSILFENGVPLPTSSWQYVDSTHIQFINAYIPSPLNTYVLQFNALVRVETPALDLGASWANYLWFPDWHAYLRADLPETGHTSVIQADFDANGNFTLPRPTNQDQTTATLIQDNGINKTTVPLSQWSFPNANTVSINIATFDSNSIYTLTYQAQTIYAGDVVKVVVEARTGVDAPSCLAATYQTVDYNTPLPAQNRFVQLRITLSNILDLRDVRLYSLLAKGLDLYGSPGVPILSGGTP